MLECEMTKWFLEIQQHPYGQDSWLFYPRLLCQHYDRLLKLFGRLNEQLLTPKQAIRVIYQDRTNPYEFLKRSWLKFFSQTG